MTEAETNRVIAHLALRLAESERRREELERAEDYYEGYLQLDKLAKALKAENDFLRYEIESLRLERKNGSN